jgi:hypothetical protein
MSPWMPLLLFGQAVAPLASPAAPRAEEHRADAVIRWNEEALEAIRREKTPPPLAARALALMHAAIFDSVNTVHQTHEPYFVRLRATSEIDPLSAACAAADAVLSDLYPGRARRFHTLRDEILDALPDGPAQKRGRTLGVYVAKRLLDDRRDDNGKGEYRAPVAVGIWRPTPPGRAAALLPGWGNLRPFGVRDKKAFRPAEPPELTSDEYARDYNEVKALGGVDSTTRTADQTLIALFWNDEVGTCTPPGHWNLIAQEASRKRRLTLAENARLFALLNLALTDAGVCCWDCKFRFKLWRPITAIHQADRDANDATVPNTKWTSLLTTPPFPTYTSGHSTFSGAAAGILAGYFKEDAIAFSIGSDGLAGQRRYKGFRAAAEEAGRSRIYGGIHFECDNREGLAVGKAIAEEILRTRLVPERPAVSSVSPRRERP